MPSTTRAPRPVHPPTGRRTPSSVTQASTTVLVISTRGDTRGAAAAEAYAAMLRDREPGTAPVVATHACASDLAEHVASADRIHVLDPGRFRAWQERRRARADGRSGHLAVPGRAADRLAVLELLRDHRSRVQWITR
jgi:hypothetical protein